MLPLPQQSVRYATMMSPFSSGQQRALAMLGAAGGNGLTQQFIAGCDLGADTVATLIEKGFASLTHEKVQGGSKTIEVAKVRITEAGRKALDREG
jgi:trans-2-enoyl-CoA reductase